MTVTSTIGTASRNYSTIAAWIASIPATLADNYVGQCYNDSEFASSSTLANFTGHTTTASFTITLTTGAGQSFADNANAQTNALKYNQANGVGINFSGSYSQAISVSDNYVTLSKLQLKATNSVGNPLTVTGTNFTLDGCIVEGASTNSNRLPAVIETTTALVRNCLFVNRVSSAPAVLVIYGGSRMANCTVVVPSDLTAASAAISSNYGTITCENCALFHAAAVASGSASRSFTTCMTDVASPPAGCTTVTYANQFQGTTNAGGDWRLKSGANCIDAGTTDTTDIPAAIDIVGTSRPQGSAWDVGCWEYVPAAAPAWVSPHRTRWLIRERIVRH